MQIFFSAGEPSGDQHAALLIRELRQRSSDIQVSGFGGPAMQKQGCHLLFELTELAVMGFLRVIPMLRKFWNLVGQAEQYFDRTPPDVVVLVDFPGFNWWIARAAKRRSIPVYYYLPPQLWGWAPWRIRRIHKWIHHVICTLPFEYEWYRKRGVRCTWVGHPFFDEVASHPLNQALVEQLQSRPASPTVAILPGSRNHEVARNWPVLIQVMHIVSQQIPGVRWVVGNYRAEHESVCRQLLEESQLPLQPEFVVGQTSEVIEAAECCLMVSGSISLELLARNKPGIVLYRVSRIGRAAARVLMNCRFITLTNLIANNELMPEFISSGSPDADIVKMADQLLLWLKNPESLSSAKNSMAVLAGHASATGATARTAVLLLTEVSVAKEPCGLLSRAA